MGVSGSGKSTVARLLAEKLGWAYYDADDFHPSENIAKMAAGIPLTDNDRIPWLAALNQLIGSQLNAGAHPVLACSALKESYRQQLLAGNQGLQFVYLHGDYDLILVRMQQRAGHYMKAEMLQSQFDALEEPACALKVDVRRKPAEIVAQIRADFGL